MTSGLDSDASLGFWAVIKRAWRIFQAHPGPLLLNAALTILSWLPLVPWARPISVIAFFSSIFPHAPPTITILVLHKIVHPVARLTMLAVAGLVWPVCADISARKVAAYCHSERQQGPTSVPTRGRFRLVKSLKVLSTVAVSFILYTFLNYGYQQLLWDGVVPVVEEGEDSLSAALLDLLYAIVRTSLNFGGPILSVFVASNTLLALPATLLDPTGKCWGFASLLHSWRLARGARWQMVGYLILTLAGSVVCFAAPTNIVEAIATPMFNPGNFLYLANQAGLPSIITGMILLLGMLEKYAAALTGPGARWCSAFLGLTASTAYFQVLWVVAYLEGLRRLELARPPETAQQNVGTGASTSLASTSSATSQ